MDGVGRRRGRPTAAPLPGKTLQRSATTLTFAAEYPFPPTPIGPTMSGCSVVPSNSATHRTMPQPTSDQILEALRVVIDPDLHQDIVSLGFFT